MSPHFIESRYCYEVEGDEALRRHRAGQASVIPIILRPCAWEETPFGHLQALPADAKPISRWPDRDEACLDAARGVMKAVDASTTRVADPGRRQSTARPAATRPVRRDRTAVEAARGNLVYCGRCGHAAGQQASCTGQYTHHAFTSGTDRDYCSRCGATAGEQTPCTGQYTHHAFTRATATDVYCSRCGVRPGKATACIGQYTHHAFTAR
jgi:hypothetical protein